MPASPPRRRFTIVDLMILVASMAGLFGAIAAVARIGRMEPFQAGIQGAVTSTTFFLSLGGLGACAARRRGRPWFEGFCLGLICGPCGMAMIALMPAPPPEGPGDPDASLTAPGGRGR